MRRALVWLLFLVLCEPWMTPVVAVADEPAVPRLMSAPPKTAGPASVWVRSTVAAAGQQVSTQFLVNGAWSTSQTRMTDEAGDVTIPLTYGQGTAGVYTWRVQLGTQVSRTLQLERLSRFAPETSVPYTSSHQVMVATRTSGYRGTYSRYEWRGVTTGWVRIGTSDAFFGWGGVKPASSRVMGDGSTPSGTYTIPFTFGWAHPGTKMLYRTVTNCSWWSSKPATYNRFVEQCGHNAGEHLRSYTSNSVGQYRQTAVIGFNYFDPRITSGKGSGSGIFLHYAEKYTDGCVGIVNRAQMNATVIWLDPAKNPRIVISG